MTKKQFTEIEEFASIEQEESHNNKLLKAIRKFRTEKNAETQQEMLGLLVNANFLTPAIIRENAATDSHGANIDFCMIKNNREESFLLAFTNKKEMRKWTNVPDQKTVMLSFHNYAEMIMSEKAEAKGFVINPYSENMAFNRSIIEMIQNALKERENANGNISKQKIEIGKETVKTTPFDRIPSKMCEALSQFAAQNGTIKAMYITKMIREKKESMLLIVDHTGNIGDILNTLGKTAAPYLTDTALNIAEYGSSQFCRETCAKLQPFYEKE